MFIRQAILGDAEPIAGCLLLAMEDIVFQFIGVRDVAVAKKLLLHFVQQECNQYSYQNCWVVEMDGLVVAAVNIYNGADLVKLREPVVKYIRARFNPCFNPEDETQVGEFYIDTLGVLPKWQSKGIGTALLSFLKVKYVEKGHQTLGLLVEPDNDNAKRLYLKMGFRAIGTKTLMGKTMEHLQLNPPF